MGRHGSCWLAPSCFRSETHARTKKSTAASHRFATVTWYGNMGAVVVVVLGGRCGGTVAEIGKKTGFNLLEFSVCFSFFCSIGLSRRVNEVRKLRATE